MLAANDRIAAFKTGPSTPVKMHSKRRHIAANWMAAARRLSDIVPKETSHHVRREPSSEQPPDDRQLPHVVGVVVGR